jgi:hypothetical protein
MAVAVLAAACASGAGSRGTTPQPAPGPPVYGPPSPPPTTPPSDLIRYGPSAMRYVVHRQLHVQQGVGESVQTQDLGTRTFLTVAISGPADATGYPATFSVDSIVADSGTAAPLTESFNRVRKLVFSGRVTPRGEFVNPVASDSTVAQSVVQLLGGFRDFLPRIPSGGLELGATWSDTLERTQKGGGLDVTLRTVTQGRAAAWEERAGTRSLRVEGTVSYDVAGKGQRGGQSMEVAGRGVASGFGFIAVDGRFLGAESRDSANLTYHLLIQGVTLPVIQITRTTVTVLP